MITLMKEMVKYETDIYEKIEDNNYTKHNELSPQSGNDNEHGGKRW